MMKKMMTIFIALTFACSSLLLMTSCAKKHIGKEEGVPPTAAAPPPPPKMKETPEKMPRKDVTAPPKMSKAEEDARLRALAEAKKLQKEIELFESESIYFDFDKSELKPNARANLTKKASWLRKNPQFTVRISGHCDERGTNEYNLALGERRASAARKFLTSLGVSSDRLTTVSFGEERPVDRGHNEKAWAKNRRDEFKLLK